MCLKTKEFYGVIREKRFEHQHSAGAKKTLKDTK